MGITQHNREPCVWLDKQCLDQHNIESDLRCLPVFLNGCRTLVILWGATYLNRLWCLCEIFTFVHMGGALDQIKIIPVLRSGHEGQDMHALTNSHETLDVDGCECAVQEDKD